MDEATITELLGDLEALGCLVKRDPGDRWLPPSVYVFDPEGPAPEAAVLTISRGRVRANLVCSDRVREVVAGYRARA